jgi:phenylacetate-coenzyme A ligase PaaK-like adenylate-forming protein
MPDYEMLRTSHERQYRSLLTDHFARLNWSEDELRSHRQQSLRSVLAAAKERAPWHRDRLAHINAETVTEADLPSIPTMTKHDLMENFDGVLTDARLSRVLVEQHIDALTDDAYLLDEHHAVASGGSSGTRGVFVYDWQGWLVLLLTLNRWRLRAQLADPAVGLSPTRAVVAASKASHMSYAVVRTLGVQSGATNVPATLPLSDIVAKLNDLQPTMLSGYPTMLTALAHEAQTGRLRIQPRLVTAMSEPVLAEMRSAIGTAWNCPLLNYYGCSEGASAGACGMGHGMHLNEDECIFELVDREGRAVAPGQRAAKLYITPLFNKAMPLIRYELTDELTMIDEPCACGSVMRRVDDVEGRADDSFTYDGGVLVHPLNFRSTLGKEPRIIEYQVRQTERGADVSVCVDGLFDATKLGASIERELRRLGVGRPIVRVEVVASLDRQSTGKFKRFVPLGA